MATASNGGGGNCCSRARGKPSQNDYRHHGCVYGVGLAIAESKTETVHLRKRKGVANVLTIEAAGQRFKKTETFTYLGGTIHSTGDTMVEIMRRGGLAHLCFKKYQRQVYECPNMRIDAKIRVFKANFLGVLLYGYSMWTLLDLHDAKLMEWRFWD